MQLVRLTVSPAPRKAEKTDVLAQLSRDPSDNHYPMLIYEPQVFRDFKITMRIKTVAGEKERMAGIVFRYQNERNFYYCRASSLGKTFRWLKVVDGVRSDPIGPDVEIPSGVWHEMSVECKGTEIICRLNDVAIPAISDPAFYVGKIGFWTKSDSVSHFGDVRITYTPHITLAQQLVLDTLKTFPRLVMVRISGKPSGDNTHWFHNGSSHCKASRGSPCKLSQRCAACKATSGSSCSSRSRASQAV